MSDSRTILTPSLFSSLQRLPPAKRRKVIAEVGRREWELCSNDIFYWLDASRHVRTREWPQGLPYVYTLDPKPLYRCLLCNDTNSYFFNKCHLHLEIRHQLEANTQQEIKKYFEELPTTRPFTLFPYMIPMTEWWLRKQFVFVEKSRDMMATWWAVTMYTWDTLFHEGRQNIFQSENAGKTDELVRRAWFIYRNQPKFLKNVHKAVYGKGQSRSGEMILESLNSEILGFPQGPEQIRQYHPTGVFQDEAAFQVGAGDAFAAIKPAVMAGGRFTAVSSANPGWFQAACSDTTDSEVL